jgi:hypothetical protein
MAEIVTVLSTCWTIIKTIEEVVSRIEQTREDARALRVCSNRGLTASLSSYCLLVLEDQGKSPTSPPPPPTKQSHVTCGNCCARRVDASPVI